ncbi:response regulator transcription factor [Streptomyces orinoci]|uniref:Response regulator transcription factor n=2 Tax=Streptomyces orinoci TaxID=67339 RepID=A0ABV3JSI3_STRON|nr:response regulator transcription factor [Streptomyces orinoci]
MAADPGGLENRPLRVLVVDDNPVVRAGLSALLSGGAGLTVVAEAADGHQAVLAARRHRPDVTLLDVRMPRADGLSVLPALAELTAVLMLTYSEETETVHRALRLGAGGYLVHGEFTAEELITAVRDLRAGRAHFTATPATALLAHMRASLSPLRKQLDLAQCQLSRREVEVMDLIASGMTNTQIAAACFISEKTVKNHINRIFTKLGADHRSQAIALWLGTARREVRR